jgi:hypothetical protein
MARGVHQHAPVTSSVGGSELNRSQPCGFLQMVSGLRGKSGAIVQHTNNLIFLACLVEIRTFVASMGFYVKELGRSESFPLCLKLGLWNMKMVVNPCLPFCENFESLFSF